jgi:hypothetical protein
LLRTSTFKFESVWERVFDSLKVWDVCKRGLWVVESVKFQRC